MGEIVDIGPLCFDMLREARIHHLSLEFQAAPDKEHRKRIANEMRAAIAARSEEQVRRMEIEQGLREA